MGILHKNIILYIALFYFIPGVTQELIDDTRLSTERQMLSDLEYVAQSSEDLEMRDRNGATPVSLTLLYLLKKLIALMVSFIKYR